MDPIVRIELDKLWAYARDMDRRRIYLALAMVGVVWWVWRGFEMADRFEGWMSNELWKLKHDAETATSAAEPWPEQPTDSAPPA